MSENTLIFGEKEKDSFIEDHNQMKKDACDILRADLAECSLVNTAMKVTNPKNKGEKYILSKQMIDFFEKEYSPAVKKLIGLLEKSDDNLIDIYNKNKEDFINFDKCFDKMLDYQSRISKYFH
ncbi:hypothetical protein WA158_003463 [Blastocystis sp. Blastoise]